MTTPRFPPKFPIDKIRAQFPALGLTDNGKPRIYFDNPAGTQVPQSVVDAVSNTFIHSNANQGGAFRTSHAADKVVDDAHQAMADFLGTPDKGEIVIGDSTTTLGFHMSRSIARDFKPGDEIIVTRMDHEGNVAPWLEIAKDKNLVIKWLEFNTESWQIEIVDLKKLLSPRTKLLALNYASNMTGMINDVKGLTAAAKAVGALVYVDAVQFAPHGLTAVHELGCDFLVCSSYKFFGPHLGILWGRRDLLTKMHAYKCRCASDEFPSKFETGTPQIELLGGLAATIDYFANIGAMVGSADVKAGSRRDKIKAAIKSSLKYEEALTKRLIDGLAAIDGIDIIGSTSDNQLKDRVPTVSFRHKTKKPLEIATKLAADNIFVWNGHNYAFGIVTQLGIPIDEGVVRVGPTHYNTLEEVDRTVEVVRRVVGR